MCNVESYRRLAALSTHRTKTHTDHGTRDINAGYCGYVCSSEQFKYGIVWPEPVHPLLRVHTANNHCYWGQSSQHAASPQ